MILVLIVILQCLIVIVVLTKINAYLVLEVII